MKVRGTTLLARLNCALFFVDLCTTLKLLLGVLKIFGKLFFGVSMDIFGSIDLWDSYSED
jgi:hypothetical protein